MEEHCIEIKGIVEKLNNAIGELHSFHPDCRIHRVSEGLRGAKREAYQPMVISIGPYHIKNPKLQAMKNHKLRYLHLLLERRKENVEKYIVEMKKLEGRVRNCYVEPIHDLNSEEFVEMMLLDACFIIEFFRRNDPDPILNVDCTKYQIYRDLMLLENQLPYFLLSCFYDMTYEDPEDSEDSDHDDIENPEDPDHDDIENPEDEGFLKMANPEDPDHDDIENPEDEGFLKMAKNIFITSSIPLQYLNSTRKFLFPAKIKHLLHLVHVLCQQPSGKPRARSYDFKMMFKVRSPMHSAVELEEAGVKFKKPEEAGVKFKKPNAKHLFNIEFDNGLMVLPCFTLDDRTDTFFRNLITFEQHSRDVDYKYFTEYAYFMHHLINSEIDVKLLRDKGIIMNYLGDDKEVSNFFNKLCDGVVSYTTFCDDVISKVDKHYNKPLNRMRAKLRRAHNYFDTPWATASTIAAVVLLLLTLLQTIAAFKYK